MITRRTLAWLLAVVLVCVAAMVVLQLTGHGPQDLLARYFGGYLQSVPDERVRVELQQLAELDQIGSLVLVDALGSERSSVATSAAAVLDAQLDGWRALPRGESSRRVGGLARNLARRVDRWPAGARSAAGDLALRILDWPIDGRYVDRAALIADCEHVLRERGTDVKGTAAVPDRSVRRQATATGVASKDGGPQPRVDLSASAIPGGSLPVEEVELPPLPQSLTTLAEPRSVGPREPTLLPTPTAPRTAGRRDPDRVSTAPGPLPEGAQPDATSEERFSPIQPLSNDVPLPTDSDLEQLADQVLFSQLDHHDASRASRAEAILTQRGYRALDLTLARKLTSANVAVRRQLVDTVARLPHAAGRWLVWLSHDPDPGVREAAVSRMVTAQDPRVQRRLLEMETDEADEVIRDQLRKWRESQE